MKDAQKLMELMGYPSQDFYFKLLAWFHVKGHIDEATVMNEQLNSDIKIAQNLCNIKSGETPNDNINTVFSYVNEIKNGDTNNIINYIENYYGKRK